MNVDFLVEPNVKTRLGRLVVILDHWPDYFETAARDAGPSGDGGVFLLPGMSRHPSVVELGRALGALHEFAPNKSAHLFGFYGSPWRTVDFQRKVRAKNGKHFFEPSRRRERVLPPWVRLEKVRVGVRLVAAECPRGQEEARPWVFRGDPFVPAPLLEPVRSGVAA